MSFFPSYMIMDNYANIFKVLTDLFRTENAVPNRGITGWNLMDMIESNDTVRLPSDTLTNVAFAMKLKILTLSDFNVVGDSVEKTMVMAFLERNGLPLINRTITNHEDVSVHTFAFPIYEDGGIASDVITLWSDLNDALREYYSRPGRSISPVGMLFASSDSDSEYGSDYDDEVSPDDHDVSFLLTPEEQEARRAVRAHAAESASERQARLAQMQEITASVKKRARELEQDEMAARKKAREMSQGDAPEQQWNRFVDAVCQDMNARCEYTPLDMGDWCEHDVMMYYGPDDRRRCFDLIELLKHFESAVTTTKYGNPFPIYPTNPFDRYHFTLDELRGFRDTAVARGTDLAQLAPTFDRFVTFLERNPILSGKPLDASGQQMVRDQVLVKTGGSGDKNLLWKMIYGF